MAEDPSAGTVGAVSAAPPPEAASARPRSASNLFDTLPDTIFRPLAAANRRFYAALLMHLYRRAFDTAGDTPRRADVIAEIGAFIDSSQAAAFNPDADDDAAGTKSKAAREAREGADWRRYAAFYVLKDTGWLVELRDRYRRLVELSPEGRVLLRQLHQIATGDTRSYGGTVLNVLGNLEQAINHPDDAAESIKNAWQFSRDFSQHVRALGARMRLSEDAIAQKEGFGALLKAVYEDFIEKHAVSDYKTLMTAHNPFRFRRKIMSTVEGMESNHLLMSRLAESYVRQGKARDVETSEATLRTYLREVYDTFATIDDRLSIISESQHRVQRRLYTAVQYMDREDGGRLEKAIRFLRAVGKLSVPQDAMLETPSHLLRLPPPAGGQSLLLPRVQPGALDRTRVRRIPPDPAVMAFEAAKEAYAARLAVTPTRVAEFVEQVLGAKDRIEGVGIPVLTVDDFIVFQRLREIGYMFDGYLSGRYNVELLPGHGENGWMVFPNFAISRVAEEAE